MIHAIAIAFGWIAVSISGDAFAASSSEKLQKNGSNLTSLLSSIYDNRDSTLGKIIASLIITFLTGLLVAAVIGVALEAIVIAGILTAAEASLLAQVVTMVSTILTLILTFPIS